MNKLAFVLAFLVTFPVLAQPVQQQVFSRIRDALDPTKQASVNRPTDVGVAPAGIYGVDQRGFGYCYDTVAAQWYPVRGTNGYLQNRIQDGDSTVLADVEDTISDGKALTLNSLIVYAVMAGYNGATVDMGRVGAVKEWQMTDVATRPGEDAGRDLAKTEKTEVKSLAFPKETSGNIVGAAVVVLASKLVNTLPNCCVYYRNKDAAVPLTDAAVYTSPDGAGTCGGANWASLAWTGCDTLAAGATCVYCFSDLSYMYFCGTATAAANPLDVDSVEVTLVCNKG